MANNEPRVFWEYRHWQKKTARAGAEQEHEEQAAQRAARPARKARKEAVRSPGDLVGTVAEVQKYRVLVLHEGNLMPCRPAGALAAARDSLVVGDRVAFDLEEKGRGLIRQILPRQTQLVRMRTDRARRAFARQVEDVLAANVDTAAIVASVTAPPFSPPLIDRYLVLCQYGDIQPLICLNKCDLVETPPDLDLYRRIGIPVVYTSASTGQGIEELRDLLRGKFSVLTGHSGVGKSSLINRLLGEQVLKTAEVNPVMGRGRHTTSVSSLHRLDDASYLIDTPGIRALGLWHLDRESLWLYFPDFEEPATRCKYRDCLHLAEPECGVKAAVATGEVSPDRYDSYVRLATG